MKKILLIFAFLFIGISTQSQILISLLLGDKLNSEGLEFGLEGGFNWSTISGLETNKMLNTWNLGFYFDIRIKNQLYLYTGTLVKARLGVDKLSLDDLAFLKNDTYNDEGDYSQQINYFLVPVLIKYRFKNRIYVEGGPQFGLMYNAWVEFNSSDDEMEASIKTFNKDMINRIDVGAMVGTGFKIKESNGLTIGVKYYYGFIDVYKDRSGTNNSSIFLKLNIPIGAEKAKKK
ncbi:MAG: PorT family protein [Bacteroidales bacterium]|nr:PorT family protein [Bacteroidales bacterium]